jgi:hypothetical protein
MSGYTQLLANRDGHVITRRRGLVSKYRAQYKSIREIQSLLANEGELNPETGKPWNHQTIANDLNYMNETAKEIAKTNIMNYRNAVHEQYIELWELEKQRITNPNHNIEPLLKVLKSIRELHGMDEAKTIIIDQVQSELVQAIDRIQLKYGGNPELCNEIISTIVGSLPIPLAQITE